jgi:hypothetical protein
LSSGSRYFYRPALSEAAVAVRISLVSVPEHKALHHETGPVVEVWTVVDGDIRATRPFARGDATKWEAIFGLLPRMKRCAEGEEFSDMKLVDGKVRFRLTWWTPGQIDSLLRRETAIRAALAR